MGLSVIALEGVGEVAPGDDLAALLVEAARPAGGMDEGDVLTISHKVVSKAEGRVRGLDEVTPGDRARALAAEHGKDPRHVQVVLDESTELLRAERGVLICRTRTGLVCANAGVDASNAPAPDAVVLLPLDPDASARALRSRVHELAGVAPAVLITDSFGRAWRQGQTDVAIGCAGVGPLDDWRGRADASGRELSATWIAVADQIAAAADLVRAKDSRQPAVLVRGLERFVRGDDGPGAAALVRRVQEDLFR